MLSCSVKTLWEKNPSILERCRKEILLTLKRNIGVFEEKSFWCWREILVMLERNPGDVREKSWWCWRKILAMLKRNPGDVTGPILENSWTVGALIGNLLTWKIFFLPLYFFTLVHSTKSIAICPMIYFMDTCETAGIKFIPFFFFLFFYLPL